MIRARAARGWSQTQLAAAADVSLSTVSRTENVTHAPRVPEAERMAKALKITIERLLAISELVEQPASAPARTRKATTRKAA